jgi:hypothetical protein
MDEFDPWVVTAIHESGHCVLYWRARLPFYDVRIYAVDGDTRGSVRTPGGFFDPVTKALASLAGPCAEEFYTGVDLARQPKSRTDITMAREAVARLGSADFDWLIPRARALVRQEWPRIQTIAAALLQRGRLDYADVLGLIRSQAWPKAKIDRTSEA